MKRGSLTTVDIIQSAGIFVLFLTLVFIAIQAHELSKQTARLENSIKGNTVAQISSSHRELWSLLIVNPTLYTQYIDSASIDDKRLNSFLSMIINHAYSIWQQYSLGNLPEDFWKPVSRDIIKTIESKPVYDRWQVVKEFHPEPFRSFVDNGIAQIRDKRGHSETAGQVTHGLLGDN